MIVLTVNTNENEQVSLSWFPSPADSTWAHHDSNYVKNPNANISKLGDVIVCQQQHLSGTHHSTAYRWDDTQLHAYTLVVTISPVSYTSVDWSIQQIQNALQIGVPELLKSHQGFFYG